MKIINKHINSTIIATAVTLFQAAVPGLTPSKLIAAIRGYDEDKASTKDQDRPKVYRISEICTCLKITRQSVYNLINSGKLMRIKIGAATRITAESLEKLLQDGA